MSVVTIDFETEGIVVGSAAPPKPIGVAIKCEDGLPYYRSFGHVGQNGLLYKGRDGKTSLLPATINKSYAENKDFVRETLKEIVEGDNELVFHNAKFDLRVLKHYFHLQPKSYKHVHDTMLLLFLLDNNQKRIGLKESAERLLGIEPTEKQTLETYMIENQESMGVKVSKTKKKDNYYMKLLKYAPVEIVGDYAINDVEITYKLFKHILGKVC